MPRRSPSRRAIPGHKLGIHRLRRVLTVSRRICRIEPVLAAGLKAAFDLADVLLPVAPGPNHPMTRALWLARRGAAGHECVGL